MKGSTSTAASVQPVDTSALTKNAATGTDLIDQMVQALELFPSLTNVRPAFYCNRTVKSFLRRQIANKVANATLSMDVTASMTNGLEICHGQAGRKNLFDRHAFCPTNVQAKRSWSMRRIDRERVQVASKECCRQNGRDSAVTPCR